MDSNENTQDRFISLKAINPTKSAITSLAKQVSEQVSEGLIDPISMITRITAMSQLCEEVRKEIAPLVIEQLDRNSKKIGYGGATIESAEVGTKYDYSVSEEWNRLKAEEDKIAVQRKKLEDQMKKIPAGKVLVDEDSGETLYGAIKSSTSSFKITLGK